MPEHQYRFRGETKRLDETERQSAPGRFVQLTDGIVHYQIAGAAEAQPVVLIPGFSVPFYIWDATFTPLAEAGLRALRYDLFGRGYSDRPAAKYDRALFDRQLVELLAALEITQPVDLVGLSMGGPIAAYFTAKHPEKVRRLCLIGPAGVQAHLPVSAFFIRTPWLGEWIMDRFGERVLVSSQMDDFFQPEKFAGYAEKYTPYMQYIGFRGAILSTIRNDMLENAQEVYTQVGKQNRPVLLLWGRHDHVVPFELNQTLRRWIPEAEFYAIEEAGHVCHYERPEVVNPILIQFLKSNASL